MASGDNVDVIEVVETNVLPGPTDRTEDHLRPDHSAEEDNKSTGEKITALDNSLAQHGIGGLKTPVGVSRHKSERERKIGHRRVGVGGEITYKKIQTTQIMGSIQLGIQHAVGGLASKPERDLLMQDFMTVETTNFPSEGSNHTPAHHFSEFKFKNYAPIAFRYFRDLFGIQPDDFLMSMCSAPLRELSNPGASGSIFYLTEDDEFIIKTVQHKEGEFLQTLLPGYYMNLNQNPRTLLPKFFGLYCYRCNSKNVRLVAMNNLLPSSVKLHQKYDLKGSTYKRKASKMERSKSSPTYKDLDFMEHHPEGIFLEADTYNALVKTIQRDCRVLESFKIMDYSLLVGIHNLDQAAREKAQEQRLSASADEEVGEMGGEGGGFIQGEREREREDRVGATALNRSRSINRQRLVAHSTAMESIQAESEPIDEEDDVPSPGGIPARNARGERLLLFLGIIDILQSYRLKKKLEHTLKSMIHDGDTVSVHRPGFYAQRFQDFMAKTVFKKIPSLDLPEIKGNHRKFRNLVTSYIALKHSPSKRKSITRPLRPLEGDFDSTAVAATGSSTMHATSPTKAASPTDGAAATAAAITSGSVPIATSTPVNQAGVTAGPVSPPPLTLAPVMAPGHLEPGTATTLTTSTVSTSTSSATKTMTYPAVLKGRTAASPPNPNLVPSGKIPPPVPPRGTHSRSSARSSDDHHRGQSATTLSTSSSVVSSRGDAADLITSRYLHESSSIPHRHIPPPQPQPLPATAPADTTVRGDLLHANRAFRYSAPDDLEESPKGPRKDLAVSKWIMEHEFGASASAPADGWKSSADVAGGAGNARHVDNLPNNVQKTSVPSDVTGCSIKSGSGTGNAFTSSTSDTRKSAGLVRSIPHVPERPAFPFLANLQIRASTPAYLPPRYETLTITDKFGHSARNFLNDFGQIREENVFPEEEEFVSIEKVDETYIIRTSPHPFRPERGIYKSSKDKTSDEDPVEEMQMKYEPARFAQALPRSPTVEQLNKESLQRTSYSEARKSVPLDTEKIIKDKTLPRHFGAIKKSQPTQKPETSSTREQELRALKATRIQPGPSTSSARPEKFLLTTKSNPTTYKMSRKDKKHSETYNERMKRKKEEIEATIKTISYTYRRRHEELSKSAITDKKVRQKSKDESSVFGRSESIEKLRDKISESRRDSRLLKKIRQKSVEKINLPPVSSMKKQGFPSSSKITKDSKKHLQSLDKADFSRTDRKIMGSKSNESSNAFRNPETNTKRKSDDQVHPVSRTASQAFNMTSRASPLEKHKPKVDYGKPATVPNVSGQTSKTDYPMSSTAEAKTRQSISLVTTTKTFVVTKVEDSETKRLSSSLTYSRDELRLSKSDDVISSSQKSGTLPSTCSTPPPPFDDAVRSNDQTLASGGHLQHGTTTILSSNLGSAHSKHNRVVHHVTLTKTYHDAVSISDVHLDSSGSGSGSGGRETKSSLSVESGGSSRGGGGMTWTPPAGSAEGSTPTWTEGTPSFTESSSSGDIGCPTTPIRGSQRVDNGGRIAATVEEALASLTTEMRRTSHEAGGGGLSGQSSSFSIYRHVRSSLKRTSANHVAIMKTVQSALNIQRRVP